MSNFSPPRPLRLHVWGAALLVCLAGAFLSNVPLYVMNRIFGSEDLNAYYRWTDQFTQAVREGVWRPRWDGLGTETLGSPAFLFVSPLYFYAAALLRGAGFGVWAAMRGVSWAVTFLAGVVTWDFLRRRVSVAGALAGALMVQTSPILFHLLALHNLCAMHAAVLPLLWCCFATADFASPRVSVRLASAVAALLLTHPLAAFMALATLPFFFAPDLIHDFQTTRRRVWAWGLSCLLGLGLAGYYLVPALTTQHLIVAEEWYEPFHRDWRNSFILPWFTAGRYGMRWFGVQWGLGGLSVLSLVALGFGLWRARRVTVQGQPLRRNLTLAVAAACFMAWEGSFPLWRAVPLLHAVQWPYRFLLVALPVAVVALVLQVEGTPDRARRGAALAALLLSPALSAALQIRCLPHTARPDFSALRVHDYIRIPVSGEAWKDYVHQKGFASECAAQGVAFSTIRAGTHDRIWRMVVREAVDLRLPLFYFPAWRVSVDGRAVEARADETTRLLTIALPPGPHEVRVRWTLLPQEKIGLVISTISIVIAGVVVLKKKMEPES